MEFLRLLMVVMAVSMLTTCIQGDILASSKIEKCLQTTSDPHALNCTKKMIVLITVVNGKLGESDSIQAVVQKVQDPIGQSKEIATPYSIQIAKSDVYYNYPVIYTRTFNQKPYETFIYKTSCNDGGEYAVCGWMYYPDGSHIPFSIGYCCVCTSDDEWNADVRYKTNVKCNDSTWHSERHNASASCLRFDNNWWPTYFIQPPETVFTITVNYIQMPPIDNTVVPPAAPESVKQQDSQTLVISPSNPIAKTTDGKMKVKLIGDFVTYKRAMDFGDRMLSIANKEGTSDPDPDQTKWLALGSGNYDASGAICNKIGVSFEGFFNVGDRCNVALQSCLQNQLFDFRNIELQRAVSGEQLQWSLAAFGHTDVYDYGRSKREVHILQNQSITSTLTLELVADEIRWAVHVSPGKIISAQIEQFAALSRNGWLYVVVENTGKIVADYTVTVNNCSEGINNPQARQLSLEAGVEPTVLSYTIHATDDYAAQRSCTVTLYDSDTNLLDVFPLNFNTSATKYSNGSQDFAGPVPELYNQTAESGGGWGFGWGFGWLKNLVSSIWGSCESCSTITCFIIHFCVVYVLQKAAGFIVAGLAILSIGALIWFGSGPLLKMFKKGKKSKKKSSKKKKKKKKSKR